MNNEETYYVYDLNSKKIVDSGSLQTCKNYAILNNQMSKYEIYNSRGVEINQIESLNNNPIVIAYRTMQLIEGKLYPSMSAKINNNLREPTILGQWERSKENPSLRKQNGKFTLDKANKNKIEAVYNPYFHTSDTMLNDQFASAQDRNNLVVVECEIPLNEINGDSKYQAEFAHDSIGKKQWKAGTLQEKINGKRNIFLTRYDKPVRIVSDREVAINISNILPNKTTPLPTNIFWPNLQKELKYLGYSFIKTNNQENILEGKFKGRRWTSVYGDSFKNYNKDIEGYIISNKTIYNETINKLKKEGFNCVYTPTPEYTEIKNNFEGTQYIENPGKFFITLDKEKKQWNVDSYEGIIEKSKIENKVINYFNDTLELEELCIESGIKSKSYYNSINTRKYCHDIKEQKDTKKYNEALHNIALYLSSQIPENSLLIPAPNHGGEALYTKELALTIAHLSNSDFMNVLSCKPHETLYEQKKEGKEEELKFFFKSKNLEDTFYAVKDNYKNIYFIDNVISTGQTFNAAQKLIPELIPCAYAICNFAKIQKQNNEYKIINLLDKENNKMENIEEETWTWRDFSDGSGYLEESDGKHRCEYNSEKGLIKTSNEEYWYPYPSTNKEELKAYLEDYSKHYLEEDGTEISYIQESFPPKQWKYNDIKKGLSEKEINQINEKTSDSYNRPVFLDEELKKWQEGELKKYPEERNKVLYEVYNTLECINYHKECELLLSRNFERLERIIKNDHECTPEEYLKNNSLVNPEIKKYNELFNKNWHENHFGMTSIEKYYINDNIEIYKDSIYIDNKKKDYGDFLYKVLNNCIERIENPKQWDTQVSLNNDLQFIQKQRRIYSKCISIPLNEETKKELLKYDLNESLIYTKNKALYEKLTEAAVKKYPNTGLSEGKLLKDIKNEIQNSFNKKTDEYTENINKIKELENQIQILKQLNNTFTESIRKITNYDSLIKDNKINSKITDELTFEQKNLILKEVQNNTNISDNNISKSTKNKKQGR